MSCRLAGRAGQDAADPDRPASHERAATSPQVRRWTLILPRAPLPEALAICLDLLEHDTARFEPAAVSWHGRFCVHAPRITIVEARSALAALDDLRGADRDAAARRLRALSLRHDLDEVAETLARWLAGCKARRSRRYPSSPRIDVAAEPTPLLPASPGHRSAVA